MAISRLPLQAASCSGVAPMASGALGSAPCAISALTRSRLPDWMASCRSAAVREAERRTRSRLAHVLHLLFHFDSEAFADTLLQVRDQGAEVAGRTSARVVDQVGVV